MCRIWDGGGPRHVHGTKTLTLNLVGGPLQRHDLWLGGGSRKQPSVFIPSLDRRGRGWGPGNAATNPGRVAGGAPLWSGPGHAGALPTFFLRFLQRRPRVRTQSPGPQVPPTSVAKQGGGPGRGRPSGSACRSTVSLFALQVSGAGRGTPSSARRVQCSPTPGTWPPHPRRPSPHIRLSWPPRVPCPAFRPGPPKGLEPE